MAQSVSISSKYRKVEYNECPISIRLSDKWISLTDMWKAQGSLWKALPSVAFSSRQNIPQVSGIYFVTTENRLVYVGRSVNMHERWEKHHRIHQLTKLPQVEICWVEIKEVNRLAEVESSLIKSLQPELNNKYCKTKVKANSASIYSQKLCEAMQHQEVSFYQVLDVFYLRLQARGKYYSRKCHAKIRLLDILEARVKPRLQEYVDVCCAILGDCDISKDESWALGTLVERIEEDSDPELGITRSRGRAIAKWKKQGKSEEWIQTRLKEIEGRNYLTDELKDRGIDKPWQYGVCTNEIYKPVLGGEAKDVKEERGIAAKSNLRDSLDDVESAAIILAEALARKKMRAEDLQGFKECRDACSESGSRVKKALE